MSEVTDRQLLQETHDAIIELSAVVLGVKGRGGLLTEMQEVKLAVTDMRLKTKEGDSLISNVITEMIGIRPQLKEIDKELHDKDKGICAILNRQDEKVKSNNILIKALWVISGSVILSLIALVVTHII
jgi:argonaute-like protein implicated in RNA metabolism and viral defense